MHQNKSSVFYFCQSIPIIIIIYHSM